MKKLLLLFFVVYSFSGYGQKLNVTPDGLKNSVDIEKTYVIIEVPNMTAKQLYDNAIKYVNQNYKNPDEVIKGKTDSEYLKFDTYNPELVFIKNGGIKQFFSAKYITELNFKDGKVKYEIIELAMNHTKTNAPLYFTGGGLNWYLFNKKGVLKKEQAKTDIGTYFNAQISLLADFLQGKGADDNW
jgi:hypothetical protein